MDCPPRWATPRTRRRTLGPKVTAQARQIGLTLLPWQKLVLNIALEQARGRPAYRDVYVSVPRQSGKSVLTLALIVWQMVACPGSTVLYGAQTRVAARRKMLGGWWPLLARSPLAGDLKLFRGFGNESITHANGSVLELMSSAESAGHGDTCDLCVVDEAWVHVDARHEQAVRPTMATRPRAQLWAVSTGSAPDGANPVDEAVWRACMPALGRLTDVETVRADLANMGVAEFRRGYLNVWPDPQAEGWRLFDQEAWERARGEV